MTDESNDSKRIAEKEARRLEAERNRQRKLEFKNQQRERDLERERLRQYQAHCQKKHTKLWWWFYHRSLRRAEKRRAKENEAPSAFRVFCGKVYDKYYSIPEKIGGWCVKHRIYPFFIEFGYFLFQKCGFCFFSMLFLAPLFLFGLIYSRSPLWFYPYFTGCLCLALLGISIAIEFLFIRVVPCYLLDLLSFKRKVRNNVELKMFCHKVTNPLWIPFPISDSQIYVPFEESFCFPSALVRFFGRKAIPCYCYYRKLKNDVLPKESPKKEAPGFYKRITGTGKRSLCYSRVFFIMTKTKAKYIDRLFEMEPTAEFEITYLLFSRYLQEIRPIEGWEYAEGVPELCEKISKMYP